MFAPIPEHMLKALIAYRDEGQPVGGFLEAVIANDLVGAAVRADSTNINLLPSYANWLYNETPLSSWGSRQAYHSWVEGKASERHLGEEEMNSLYAILEERGYSYKELPALDTP